MEIVGRLRRRSRHPAGVGAGADEPGGDTGTIATGDEEKKSRIVDIQVPSEGGAAFCIKIEFQPQPGRFSHS